MPPTLHVVAGTDAKLASDAQYESVIKAISAWADTQHSMDGAAIAQALGYVCGGLGVLSKQPEYIRKLMLESYDQAIQRPAT